MALNIGCGKQHGHSSEAESNDNIADFTGNAHGLRALCDELGFSGLNDELDSVLRRGCGEGEGTAVMESLDRKGVSV